MTARVFIDGEAGTTGLQIRARLEARDDVRLIRLGEAERKDPAARAHALNEADLAILCLPEEALYVGVEDTLQPGASIFRALRLLSRSSAVIDRKRTRLNSSH